MAAASGPPAAKEYAHTPRQQRKDPRSPRDFVEHFSEDEEGGNTALFDAFLGIGGFLSLARGDSYPPGLLRAMTNHMRALLPKNATSDEITSVQQWAEYAAGTSHVQPDLGGWLPRVARFVEDEDEASSLWLDADGLHRLSNAGFFSAAQEIEIEALQPSAGGTRNETKAWDALCRSSAARRVVINDARRVSAASLASMAAHTSHLTLGGFHVPREGSRDLKHWAELCERVESLYLFEAQGMNAAAARCLRRLRVLTVHQCSGFNDDCLRAAAAPGPDHTLRALCVQLCMSITDAGIESLGLVKRPHCRSSLCELRIFQCGVHVTGTRIGDLWPLHLRAITLVGPLVGPDAITQLLSLPSLEEISLDATLIPIEYVCETLQGHPSLKTLRITGGNHVDPPQKARWIVCDPPDNTDHQRTNPTPKQANHHHSQHRAQTMRGASSRASSRVSTIRNANDPAPKRAVTVQERRRDPRRPRLPVDAWKKNAADL